MENLIFGKLFRSETAFADRLSNVTSIKVILARFIHMKNAVWNASTFIINDFRGNVVAQCITESRGAVM